MKQLRLLALAGALVVLGLSTRTSLAQPGPQDWQGLDPQEIQKQIRSRAMEFLRDKLVVTNDAEWTVIEGRLEKVVQLKMQTLLGTTGSGLFRGFGGGPGPDGGMGGGMGGGGMGKFVQALLGFEPMKEAEALQKCVDDHASKAELKNALNKYLEARKKKEAELQKAQAGLREVLTSHQEATLVLIGILD
jgi:hypothetical protein